MIVPSCGKKKILLATDNFSSSVSKILVIMKKREDLADGIILDFTLFKVGSTSIQVTHVGREQVL